MLNKKADNVSRGCFVDWWEGCKEIKIWLSLAWFDIVVRYRRSTLGPWWITISMALVISGMGPLYAGLFGLELSKFFPYMALGIIFWTLFSSVVNECATAFLASSNYLKQAEFSPVIFIWRALARCIIQFLHQIVIYIPIAIYLKIDVNENIFYFIPGIILFIINAHFVGLFLGIICTRFRDFTQIVTSLMQLMMFLTPVFWMAESLPERAKIILWNPFSQMLDLLRNPLLGMSVPFDSWVGVSCVTLINVVLGFCVYAKFKKRIVFWI